MHAVGLVAILLLLSPRTPSANGLDHIMIGVPDLEQGIAAFQKATGVMPVRGGKHPGRGTENALVSLGDYRYIEIIAPQTGTTASDFLVTYLKGLKGPAIVGWAVHVADTSDAMKVLTKAGAKVNEPKAGSRITPQGGQLAWETFDFASPQIASAPFFIHWKPETTHPSLSSPRCSLVSFAIDDPAATELTTLLGALNVDVSTHSAAKPHMRVEIDCAGRRATFESE